MRKASLVILVFFNLAPLFSQEAVVKRYFTTRTFQNESPKSSVFKRTYSQQDSFLVVKSYQSQTLLDSGRYAGFTSMDNLDLFFRFHLYSQSYVKPRVDFSDKKAWVNQFYKKGTIHKEYHLISDSSAIQQYWTYEGVPILTEGAGKRTIENNDSTTTIIVYDQYKILESYKIRPEQGDTIQLRLDQPARPKDGLKAFHNFIAENLEYPEEALQSGIETTLYISFIIDEEG